MSKTGLAIILSLMVCAHSHAQYMTDTELSQDSVTYHVINIKDYSFKELLNEGINTATHQLDVLHIPFQMFECAIKCHIKRHHFLLSKDERKMALFRAITFTYQSITPTGEPTLLSGLVTIPILDGKKPQRMLIYHRLLSTLNSIAPSNSLPIEAVLTADNTVCVFPDYYGCGITEGNPLPFTALNYHARCATECVLAALDILQDNKIILDPEFYTWNSGYSQAAGFAMATHRFIETQLPDTLTNRINIRWSLCCDGIYSPAKLYETAILNNNLGGTPAVYLQSLRGLFYSKPNQLDGLSVHDLLSDNAIESGIDSILNMQDNGFWDLYDRLDRRDKSSNPSHYFTPQVIDTSTSLYKKIMSVLNNDDCITGWQPKSCIVLCHSKNDNTIPYSLSEQVYHHFSDTGACCSLHPIKFNKSHIISGFLYFYDLLHLNEQELYNKYTNTK